MGFELGLRQWAVLLTLALVALVVIGVVVLLPLKALLDVSRRSPEEFTAVGEDRRTWLIAMLVATFVLGPGWLGALVYLRTVKPKLDGVTTDTQQDAIAPA